MSSPGTAGTSARLSTCSTACSSAGGSSGGGTSIADSNTVEQIAAAVEKRLKRQHEVEQYALWVTTKLRVIPGVKYVVLELGIKPYVRVALQDLVKKRRKFSHAEKKVVVEAMESKNATEEDIVKELRKKPGFESVRLSQAKEWARAKVPRKCGRKGTDDAFYEAALSNLMFCKLEKVEDRETVHMLRLTSPLAMT